MTKQILIDKEFLIEHHYVLKKTIHEIAEEIGYSSGAIYSYFKKYDLKTVRYNNKKLRQQTCLKKYGVDHYSKTIESKNNRKIKCLEKYGVEHYSQTIEYKEKFKNTCLKKYGTDNYSKLEESKEKIKNACLERYGVEHYSKTDEYKERHKNTCLEKYGVVNFSQSKILKDSLEKSNNKNWLIEQHHTLKKSHVEIANDLGISPSAVDQACERFNIETKNHFRSSGEQEIVDYIKTIYTGDILENTRNIITPYELDIYIPEKNLAIEFDGLYWHSFNRKETTEEKNKHLTKTKLCSDKNIKLLHVFENEWICKRDIVKSIISNKLGVYTNKIWARKCIIKELSNIDVKDFLNTNHIQGYANAKINLGLFNEDKLVSLMTFGVPRFNRNYDWEMIRFCTAINTVVIGGASKLFKHFIKTFTPKSIISYADLRYFNGELYDSIGFNLTHSSNPNYYYIHNDDYNRLYSRVKYQKHKLKNILDNFNNELTEFDNMCNNGYRRIWDCGNLVFQYLDVNYAN